MSAPAAPHPRVPPGRLQVSVLTPEGPAFEGLAESVVVPAHDGEVAFFPGHAAFLGAIGVGELRIQPAEGERMRWYLEGGVAEVLDGVVTVLAERVQAAALLDAGRAREELEAALRAVPTTEEAFAARDRSERCARARLRIAQDAAVKGT